MCFVFWVWSVCDRISMKTISCRATSLICCLLCFAKQLLKLLPHNFQYKLFSMKRVKCGHFEGVNVHFHVAGVEGPQQWIRAFESVSFSTWSVSRKQYKQTSYYRCQHGRRRPKIERLLPGVRMVDMWGNIHRVLWINDAEDKIALKQANHTRVIPRSQTSQFVKMNGKNSKSTLCPARMKVSQTQQVIWSFKFSLRWGVYVTFLNPFSPLSFPTLRALMWNCSIFTTTPHIHQQAWDTDICLLHWFRTS